MLNTIYFVLVRLLTYVILHLIHHVIFTVRCNLILAFFIIQILLNVEYYNSCLVTPINLCINSCLTTPNTGHNTTVLLMLATCSVPLCERRLEMFLQQKSVSNAT